MSTNSLLTRPQATCGTLLTSEYLLTFPFRLEQTPYSHLASKVRYFHVTPLALAMRTNSVLTPCKQGAVLSRYSIGLSLLLPE